MSQQLSDFDKNNSAIAFAEAGEHDAARKIIGEGGAPARAKVVSRKKKPYAGALIYGAISLGLYFLLMSNQKLVTDTFTMGGWYALYPLGTAFGFSFIHGAFASDLLSVLGIEAKK
jgi:hypothetical protein